MGMTPARLVGLEANRAGTAIVEVMCPLGLEPGKRTKIAVRFPTGSRAREQHGVTVELAKPVEIFGSFEGDAGEVTETLSPAAFQRALNQSQSGIELVSIRVDQPQALLAALGLA
jgi:hypothetical protein